MIVKKERGKFGMLSQNIVKLLNKQINMEFASAYIYQAMEMYIGNEYNFPGIENFYHVQVQEETAHAYLMIDYLHRLGEKVTLEEIPRPVSDFASVLETFEEALKYEVKVSASINHIMAEAVKENDFATQSFLQFFVSEQVEEEESFTKHIQTLRFIDRDAHALLLFDKDLATRVFTPPVI